MADGPWECHGIPLKQGAIKNVTPLVDRRRHSSPHADEHAVKVLITRTLWSRSAPTSVGRSPFLLSLYRPPKGGSPTDLHGEEQQTMETVPSSLRLPSPMNTGLSSPLADLPDAGALRCFTYVRNRFPTYDFHQTSPRGPHDVGFPSREPWLSRAKPLSHRCRVPSIRAPG